MSQAPDNPARDAWATIRGFLYQTWMTAFRWLTLDEQTVLFCECEEDIDHVSRIVADPSQETRILEQVRHSEHSVTLRSDRVVRTLARFYKRYHVAEQARVRLRYATNSLPGQERGVIFPRKASGIEAWRRVAAGKADGAETVATLVGLREVLIGRGTSTRPDRDSADLAAFRDFVNSVSEDQLLAFVQSVEWAVGQPAYEDMRRKVAETIVHCAFFPPETANDAADKLLATVLAKLARRGPKRFDAAELRTVFTDTAVSTSQDRILRRIRGVEESLAGIEAGVARIERTQEAVVVPMLLQMEASLSEVRAAVLAPIGSAASPDWGMPSPDLPPGPPKYEVRRDHLTREFYGLLAELSWLHLKGSAGMGKTHVARLLMDHSKPDHLLWVSLAGHTDQASAVRHLEDQVVGWVVRRSGANSWWAAYRAGQVQALTLLAEQLRRLSETKLIVLDDVPDLVESTQLATRISEMARASTIRGAKLVTTAQRTLASLQKESLATGYASEIEVPAMAEQDVGEMLRQAGAPNAYHQNWVMQLLLTVTSGHPGLLAASVSWLEAKAWPPGAEGLAKLLTGEAVTDERDAAARKMFRLVVNSDARELLYRLSLVGRPFGPDEVQVAADVAPKLARPGELLRELDGPWISRAGSQLWEISPLLASVGASSLTDEVCAQTHLALARRILGHRPTPFPDGLRALAHLGVAGAWADSAAVMIQMMMAVQNASQARAADLLTLLFPPSAWPAEMPLAFRITIRAFQIKIASMAERDYTELDSDLEELLASASQRADEVLACEVALMTAGPLMPGGRSGVAMRRAVEATRIRSAHPILFAEETQRLPWPDIVWFPIIHLSSLGDVRDVLAVMRTMTKEELAIASGARLARHGSRTMADFCWMHMHEKPESQRDWNAVIIVLNEIEAFAQDQGIAPLLAAATRAKAIVFSNYLDRAEEGLRLISGAPQPSDPGLAFLHEYTMASLLEDQGRDEEASRTYGVAIECEGEAFTSLRFLAHARAAVVSGRLCIWEQAACRAKRGLRFALRHGRASLVRAAKPQRHVESLPESAHALNGPDSFVPTWNRLELLGELAIALWHRGLRRRAWGALCGIAKGLRAEHAPDDVRYREVFRKTGHAAGWFMSMAEHGRPPSATLDGAEYVAPQPGVFANSNPRLADISVLISPAVLCHQLGEMAAAVGLRSSALRQLVEATRYAQEGGQLWLKAHIQGTLAPIAAARSDFATALRAGLGAVAGTSATRDLRGRGEDLLTSTADPSDVWRSFPEEYKRQAQEMLFWMVFVPAMLHAVNTGAEPDLTEEWQKAISLEKDRLLDPQQWLRVTQAARSTLRPGRVQDLLDQAKQVHANDQPLRFTLYLAVSQAPDCPPEYAVQAHSVNLLGLLDREAICGIAVDDFGDYISYYWQRVADERGFLLRSPARFRTRLNSLQRTNSRTAACQTLLWAEEAAGALMPTDIRARLQDRLA